MKKVYFLHGYFFRIIAFISIILSSTQTQASQPLRSYKGELSFYLETNHLLFMPAITIDYMKRIHTNYAYDFSGGVSTIDKKKGYIVPPNIGFPINASFLYGKNDGLLEVGITLRPQFFLTKDYVHHNHFNFEEKFVENSNIVYFTPRIGYRYQDNRLLNVKVSVGPQFAIAKSDYAKYTGRVFENYEYLEKIYLHVGVGFKIK